MKTPTRSRSGQADPDPSAARFVLWGVMALLLWAPLPLASNRPLAWSFLSLVVGALLIIWAATALRHPGLARLSARRLAGPALLFALAMLWAGLQTSPFLPDAWQSPLWGEAARALGRRTGGAISIDPHASREGIMRLLAYGGIFWLCAQYGRRGGDARKLLWCILWAGLAYAIYGLVGYATGNETILWYRKWTNQTDLTSVFVARASYGAYAGIGLLTALALLFLSFRETARSADAYGKGTAAIIRDLPPAFYFLLLCCAVLATALLQTHSRGALAVTALGALVMLAALMPRAGSGRKPLVIAALVLAAGAVVLLEISGGVTLGRLMMMSEAGTGREAIHALAWRAHDAAPWTGYGLNSFSHLYYQFRDMTIPWESPRFDKAHNVYLELLVELGIAGFSLIMAALGWIVAIIVAGLFRRRRNLVFGALGLGVTAMLAAHSVLDFSIQMPAIAATYAALLGIAFGQAWPTRR